MTWPSSPSALSLLIDQLDAGGDNPQLARAQILAAVNALSLLAPLVKEMIDNGEPFLKTGGKVQGRAYTEPKTVTYSSTVAINASQSNAFYVGALTGNTTLDISSPADGQTINVRFVQDGTGSRTVTLPAGAKVIGQINPAAGGASWLTLTYVTAGSVDRWEGSWMWVPA